MTNVLDTYSIKYLAGQTDVIIRSSSSESEILYRLKPLVEKLITNPNALPAEAFVARKDKFANNLLYRPKDQIFSMMGGNWLPGQTTPIHDHLTWAMVGVCQGEERESVYRRIDDGSDPKKACLELVSERINKKGQVTVLGRTAIHRIDNVSLAPSLSIHIYGLDIGTLERHSYDPITGEISKFVSGYCNVLRDEDTN